VTDDILMQKARKVYEYLKSQGKTIATAESCTGGMIGSSLTAIAGVSEVYGYGFVTYSNEAKMQLLGVNEQTLASFGAVSAETVAEMAEGALTRSGADMAVAVSGIAGPGGGSEQKRVGLVYVGFAQKGKATQTHALQLDGDRESVRRQTVENVFDIIMR